MEQVWTASCYLVIIPPSLVEHHIITTSSPHHHHIISPQSPTGSPLHASPTSCAELSRGSRRRSNCGSSAAAAAAAAHPSVPQGPSPHSPTQGPSPQLPRELLQLHASGGREAQPDDIQPSPTHGVKNVKRSFSFNAPR